jgi:hypothetical protein
MKRNSYTELKRTENYNHLLEFTVICDMCIGIIKMREFKQHFYKQMSAPDCQATCRTLPVSISFHPKSKSSFFTDVLQSLSINTGIHTEVYSFFNRSFRFFVPRFHSLVVCTWIDCFVSGHLYTPNFGPPPMRPSV